MVEGWRKYTRDVFIKRTKFWLKIKKSTWEKHLSFYVGRWRRDLASFKREDFRSMRHQGLLENRTKQESWEYRQLNWY